MEDINQIKFALVKSKKTNKWLTEQLEVIPTTVSKWCTNTTQPDLYTLKKLAGFLNIPVSELIVSE